MKKTTVLVSGATGLLGSYIARMLVADPSFQVRAPIRPGSTKSLCAEAMPSIEWVEGDLLDLDFQLSLFEGVEMMVHAAGKVSYLAKDAASLRQNNVMLSADMANRALEAGLSHFLYISSVAAISPALPDETIDARQLSFYKHATTTRYALSKRAAELEVWRAAEEGLPVTILNPSVVLGAGHWQQGSAQLFDWVARGQRYYPSGTMGYVDVRDVAAFAKTCLESGPSGRRFILNAENWTYKDLFEHMAMGLGVKAPEVQASPLQAELAWIGASLKRNLLQQPSALTRETARKAMQRVEYDNSQTLEAGAFFRPLAQTIAETSAKYKETQARGWGVLEL